LTLLPQTEAKGSSYTRNSLRLRLRQDCRFKCLFP